MCWFWDTRWCTVAVVGGVEMCWFGEMLDCAGVVGEHGIGWCQVVVQVVDCARILTCLGLCQGGLEEREVVVAEMVASMVV